MLVETTVKHEFEGGLCAEVNYDADGGLIDISISLIDDDENPPICIGAPDLLSLGELITSLNYEILASVE